VETRSINMERINQIKIGFLVGANSGTSDFRFCSGLNLFNGVPLKFNNRARLFCKLGMWANSESTPVRLRCNIALTKPSPYIYEPLLGENRELGETSASTLTQNARLI
jgi:hypothetical protein